MKKSIRGFNPGEAVIPTLTLAFALAYLLQTKDGPLVAMRWPYIVISVTFVLWAGIVITHVLKPGKSLEKWSIHQVSQPLLIIAAPVLYLIAMPVLGFSLSSFSFQVIIFRLLGSLSWRHNLGIAFLITLLLHLALINFMSMSLPRLEFGSFIL